MQQCARKQEWEVEEKEELESIAKTEAWTKVPLPTGSKVIPLEWVYKCKEGRLGNVVRRKCRLVAQELFQVYGQDYPDT
jgi:hypothetical protein